jgi:hypothetical protein
MPYNAILRMVILMQRRSLFDLVGYAGCDRLCGESMDILGDRCLIEIRYDRCLMLLIVLGAIACVVGVRIFEAIAKLRI